MQLDIALETQDKAVGAIKAACPGMEFMSSDFDGEVLSLWFNTFITAAHMDVVKKALPGMEVNKRNERVRIDIR